MSQFSHANLKTVLQIRRGNGDNLGKLAIFLHKNILCDPSWRNGSDEGPQHMFLMINEKNNLRIFLNTPPHLNFVNPFAVRTAIILSAVVLKALRQTSKYAENILGSHLHVYLRFYWSVSLFNPFWGGGRVVRWSWVNFQCRGVLQF